MIHEIEEDELKPEEEVNQEEQVELFDASENKLSRRVAFSRHG